MRRANKKICLLAVVMLFTLWLTGCKVTVNDAQIREKAVQMTDALLEGDQAAAYALVADIQSEADFQVVYGQLRDLLADVTTYELEQQGYHKSVRNGQTVVQAEYRMETNADTYILSVQEDSLINGLSRYYITPEQYTAYVYNGTVDRMSGANVFQWIMLVIAAAELGYVIVMLVDCSRRKIKHKGLWIAAIILGALVISISLQGGQFNLKFNIGAILSHSAIVRYGNGLTLYRILIPIGAIAYNILRKKLSIPQEMPCEATESEIQEEE